MKKSAAYAISHPVAWRPNGICPLPREGRPAPAVRLAADEVNPLAGVPFAVKNLFDVAGLITLAGSKINRDRPPDRGHGVGGGRVASRASGPASGLARAGRLAVDVRPGREPRPGARGGAQSDRADYGWTSNNSIYGVVGMDYKPVIEGAKICDPKRP